MRKEHLGRNIGRRAVILGGLGALGIGGVAYANRESFFPLVDAPIDTSRWPERRMESSDLQLHVFTDKEILPSQIGLTNFFMVPLQRGYAMTYELWHPDIARDVSRTNAARQRLVGLQAIEPKFMPNPQAIYHPEDAVPSDVVDSSQWWVGRLRTSFAMKSKTPPEHVDFYKISEIPSPFTVVYSPGYMMTQDMKPTPEAFLRVKLYPPKPLGS